jgi:hypothetical protein
LTEPDCGDRMKNRLNDLKNMKRKNEFALIAKVKLARSKESKK